MTSHTHFRWFNTSERQAIIDVTADMTVQVTASGMREGIPPQDPG
ncbi:MAG TPA: hypothetical protein VGA37_01315 [Gemmatimonadales bacterium]